MTKGDGPPEIGILLYPGVQMSAALEQEHLDRAIAAFERVRPE